MTISLDDVRRRVWNGLDGRLLTLIVGASPLPNLIAAVVLCPDEVALVCSAQTAGPARLLLDAIRTHVPRVNVRPFHGHDWLVVSDPHAPVRIRATVARWAKDLSRGILFYTGGTKAMATHIHGSLAAAASGDGGELRACYLADIRDLLIFDDGYEIAVLEEVSVGLKQLAALHGLSGVSLSAAGLGDSKGGPTDADAEILCKWVLDDPRRAGALYVALTNESGHKRSAANVKLNPEPLSGLPSELSIEPVGSIPSDCLSKWIDFLRGKWLEPVVGLLAQQAFPRRETARSLAGLIERDRRSLTFDLDVAQMAGARLYAMSCTTGHAARGDRGHTKRKLFEVSARAKQLGGQLARSAVFSLHPIGTCQELELEIATVWEGDEPQPRVFGIDDLREWRAGRRGSLAQWLQS